MYAVEIRLSAADTVRRRPPSLTTITILYKPINICPPQARRILEEKFPGKCTVFCADIANLQRGRAKEIQGVQGALLEPPGPLPTHLHTAHMAHSDRLPTRLNPLAQRTRSFLPGTAATKTCSKLCRWPTWSSMRSALLETVSTMPSLAQFSAVPNGLAQPAPRSELL